MKREHAPLPWKYERWYGPNDSQEELGAAEVNCETVQELRQNNPVVRITDANNGAVVTCHDLAIIEIQDAAFIVRAVNCHDELVASLREAYGQLKETLTVLKIPVPQDSFDRYEKALSNAKEK